MKKKQIITLLLSGLVPVLIYLVCTIVQGFVPFGEKLVNIYDSFTQYGGMLLEYKKLIYTGNIFYSWGAGLGFNFFASLTYYGMSPLNLLVLFANSSTYFYYVAYMTYLRFFLLGVSMSFYLMHKNLRPSFIIILSSSYSLMGFTSCYYYNYIWIDSIIMLPLVIYGIDKIFKNKNSCFYLVTLAFTIGISYYIGYMICIFSLIYFIYRLILTKGDRKKYIKHFLISSLLAGLISAVILIPSYFGLTTGKASLYERTNYIGIQETAYTFFYNLTSGSFLNNDQSYGPAQIYTSIFVLALVIMFFFNTNFSKKEKITTFIVLAFFYLSFSINILNYAWQFFQRPIWWQSRFSFTFSFFLILIASKTLENIDKVNFKIKYRSLLSCIILALISAGAIYKWHNTSDIETFTYFFFGFSILVFLECMFLGDKNVFLPLILGITVLEIGINTYNNVRYNTKYNSINFYSYMREEIPEIINDLNAENEYFYRFELVNDYTSDDGLYFGYNGINYFNSVRNINVTALMESLGQKVVDDCHISITDFDPVYLSIFNVKYLYGSDVGYFNYVQKRLYENPYPLSIGFAVNDEIKNLKLGEDAKENLGNIINTMTNKELNIYNYYYLDSFTLENLSISNDIITILNNASYGEAYISFVSDGHYLIMNSSLTTSITVNNQKISTTMKEINEGDNVTLTYNVYKNSNIDEIYMILFDLDVYTEAMEDLSSSLLYAKTYTNSHILEGTITVLEDNTYLFTSVEYEEGMKVYVDGEEVEPDLILDALVGVSLNEGTHTIYIDYIPKGFKTGAVISAIALCVSGVYIYIIKRH